jgi:uncharacterized protein YbaR (Trm112 family)
MHVALTDVLACPRCGPRFGLILLAHRVEERRVLHGVLGCANCRERYAVEQGLGTLRVPGDASRFGEAEQGDPAATEDALRIAALLGVTEGPALLLVAGPAAREAAAIAAMVDGAEVIAVADGLERWTEEPGVSRVDAGLKLPFYSGSLHGAYLSGAASNLLLEEGARVVAARGRVVLSSVPDDAEPRLAELGLRPLARDDQRMVAARG